MPTVIYSPFITKFVSYILKAAAILSDTVKLCLLHSLILLSKKFQFSIVFTCNREICFTISFKFLMQWITLFYRVTYYLQ